MPNWSLSDANPFALLTEYELSNLAAHLVSANQAKYLHRILAMEVQGTHTNAWFEIRDKRGDTAGYSTDINRARDAAEAAFEMAIQAGEATDAVALEVHYALVSASLSSRAERMPDNLRAALVDGKLWTAHQALADARRLRFAVERAEALAVLIPSLPAASQDAAVAETLGLVEDNRLYWLVPILSSHLQTADCERLSEESQRWMDEAPYTVTPLAPVDRSMQSRINTVESCVQEMTGRQDLGTEILEPLLAASGEEAASYAVVSILLDAARSLPVVERKDFLGRLAPFIPLDLLPKAAELGYLASDALEVLEACTDLGPFLEDGVRHELRCDLEALPKSRIAAIALGKLAAAPSAPRSEKLHALSAVLATNSVTGDVWEDSRRVESLAFLADALDGQESDAALQAAVSSALETEDRRYRAEALITVASAERARPLRDQLVATAHETAAEQPDPPALQALRLLKLAQRSRGPRHLAILSEIEGLLALPDPFPDSPEHWSDDVASLVRLVQVQLRAERLAADDITSRIATIRDMLHETDSLGRIGLFISAYVERPAILRSIARLLAGLPPKECGSMMRAALHIIGRVSRMEAAPGIVALSPAIAAAGGSEAVNAVVRSARQVLAWWA